MKTHKMLSMILVSALFSGGFVVASEQGATPDAKSQLTGRSAEMTDGEIRKIDKDNRKITIRHAEIKHLDMPGMTMIFRINDPAMLNKLKPGDKVKFRAEKAGNLFVVTEIKSVK